MRQSEYLGTMGALVMAALIATGCASQSGSGSGTEKTGQVEHIGEQPIMEIDHASAQSTLQEESSASSDMSERSESRSINLVLHDVLFDFDRDLIREDAMSVLKSNARQLKEHGIARMLLEGRCDEIGTSAYNLILGERRAKNVKRHLEQLGITTDLKTISYGKDRPLCSERTSDCMQQNRSVRFVVKE